MPYPNKMRLFGHPVVAKACLRHYVYIILNV